MGRLEMDIKEEIRGSSDYTKYKHKMSWNEPCNKNVPVIKFRYDRGSICF